MCQIALAAFACQSFWYRQRHLGVIWSTKYQRFAMKKKTLFTRYFYRLLLPQEFAHRSYSDPAFADNAFDWFCCRMECVAGHFHCDDKRHFGHVVRIVWTSTRCCVLQETGHTSSAEFCAGFIEDGLLCHGSNILKNPPIFGKPSWKIIAKGTTIEWRKWKIVRNQFSHSSQRSPLITYSVNPFGYIIDFACECNVK